MITDKEIQSFWLRFAGWHLLWFCIYVLGFFSGLVIIAHFLKHVCNVKIKFWLLNDTPDGDFGAEWWLIKKKLKPGLISAFLWWWRNKAWNFYYLNKPEWNAGQVEEFVLLHLTVDDIDMYVGNKYNRFTKASKEEAIFGINYYAYRLNGKVFCNYSKATEKREKQFGAGGNEWRFLIK